jgi:hypothetical protein
MALITSRTQLNQGSSLAVAGAIWATGTGADIRIHTAVANNLPALAVGEFFEARDHTQTVNNGLYVVVTVNTSTDDYECDKVTPGTPVVAGAEAVTILGATGAGSEKSVMYDTAALGVYLLEKGNMDANGAIGQAVYSHMMQEWKDDNFLIANASFPMLAIDTDAGKYVIGQNAAGENTGWNFVDVAVESIRTRKLVRDMGWDEVDAAGVTTSRYFNATTLGTFEDGVNDNAFYQFGTDVRVDDTVDFDFAGPVNEAVRFFERLTDGQINGVGGVAISTDGRTMTRSDGGNWRTDGFIVGGKIELRDGETSTNDTLSPETGRSPGFLLSVVGAGVDGVVTVGTAADAGTGFSFIDGGGGNDQITRFDGGSWLEEGYFVTGNVIVANANIVGNDGDYIILAISADGLTLDIVTASLTADTADNTATFGPLDDILTPDLTINASINNDNAIRLGLRVRDGDANGKTFGEANLVTIGKAALGNFVFAFPLANATDLKITETDANIDAILPYTGMSVTFFATPQSKSGLVGGSFDFGIVIDGNDGTNVEVFEWIQRQLRKLTDIDNDADTAIGRAIGLLARFNGDLLEMGSGDGGLTFPVNPDGGGSGVFIDNLNAASSNDVTFFDNTGTFRSFPETIAVTLDFNQIAIDDITTEFDLFYDRTIRTNVTDFVLGVAGGGQITSAGANLPNNAELGAGSYVRVSGLTAGDAPMNGVYQITAETTPGSDWTVVRYDGAAIVAVTVTTVEIDQNAVDTPDAIIVHTNIGLTATTISFTAPDTIGDTGSGFGIFAVGDIIEIEGTTSGLNDGIFEIDTVIAGTITLVEQTITTQGASPSVTITKIASGLASADFAFNYDFDGNVQGGRTVSTTTFVTGKAIGSTGSQYVASPVSSILSGTPLTIPLFAQTERNFA